MNEENPVVAAFPHKDTFVVIRADGKAYMWNPNVQVFQGGLELSSQGNFWIILPNLP